MVNLTIGGGSFKGISYIGALEYLYKNNLVNKIENFYGTSIGSIIGILFIISYKPFEIFNEILKINLSEYWDLNLQNLDTNYSLLSIKFFERIEYIFSLKENINITFLEFYNKYKVNINIFATSINSRKNVCFNKEKYSNLRVLTIIRASCSIPLIFPPVKINDELYVDGCMKCIDGVCVDIIKNDIDNNKIHFIIKSDYCYEKINSFGNYIAELLSCSTQNNEILNTEHTILIKSNSDYTNKYNFNDINNTDKLKLYYSGIYQAKEQFKDKIFAF